MKVRAEAVVSCRELSGGWDQPDLVPNERGPKDEQNVKRSIIG